jgi:hypothetical protein
VEYEAATDTAKLTGNPKLVLPQGEMPQSEVLIWERANNTFRALNYREMTISPDALNKTNAPALLKK